MNSEHNVQIGDTRYYINSESLDQIKLVINVYAQNKEKRVDSDTIADIFQSLIEQIDGDQYVDLMSKISNILINHKPTIVSDDELICELSMIENTISVTDEIILTNGAKYAKTYFTYSVEQFNDIVKIINGQVSTVSNEVKKLYREIKKRLTEQGNTIRLED
jgi:hypothetical protein